MRGLIQTYRLSNAKITPCITLMMMLSSKNFSVVIVVMINPSEDQSYDHT